MRKIYFLLLSTALLASCIDPDYDLTKVDTENITLGEEMHIPLATIHVTMQELRQGSLDIEGVFAEADDWLPATLPEGANYVDIVALNRHEEYLDTLIDALIEEMKQPDGRKLATVAERICADYKSQFLSLLGLPSSVPDEVFKTTFQTEFLRQEVVQEQSKQLARDYLSDINIDAMSYRIDGVSIADEVVDMLCDNLDAESVPAAGRTSTLHLYGEIRSKLPVSMLLEPRFSSTRLDFQVEVDATLTANPIAESDGTQLFEQDLRQIVGGVDVTIPVTLEKYYPAIGFRSDVQEQVAIDLRLVKRGGLKINI